MSRNSETPTYGDQQGRGRSLRAKSPRKKIGVGTPLVAAFVEQCCVLEPSANTKVSRLWAAFKAFVDAGDVPTPIPTPTAPLADTYAATFSKRLGELGFGASAVGGIKSRKGLKLKPPEKEVSKAPAAVPSLEEYEAAFVAARGGDRSTLDSFDIRSMAWHRRLLDMQLFELNNGGTVVDEFEVDGKKRQRLAPGAEFVRHGLTASGITADQQLISPESSGEPDAAPDFRNTVLRMREATEAKRKPEPVN